MYKQFSLKQVLSADFERQGMRHPFWAKLTFGEHAYVWKYIKDLRKLEYHS